MIKYTGVYLINETNAAIEINFAATTAFSMTQPTEKPLRIHRHITADYVEKED